MGTGSTLARPRRPLNLPWELESMTFSWSKKQNDSAPGSAPEPSLPPDREGGLGGSSPRPEPAPLGLVIQADDKFLVERNGTSLRLPTFVLAPVDAKEAPEIVGVTVVGQSDYKPWEQWLTAAYQAALPKTPRRLKQSHVVEPTAQEWPADQPIGGVAGRHSLSIRVTYKAIGADGRVSETRSTARRSVVLLCGGSLEPTMTLSVTPRHLLKVLSESGPRHEGRGPQLTIRLRPARDGPQAAANRASTSGGRDSRPCEDHADLTGPGDYRRGMGVRWAGPGHRVDAYGSGPGRRGRPTMDSSHSGAAAAPSPGGRASGTSRSTPRVRGRPAPPTGRRPGPRGATGLLLDRAPPKRQHPGRPDRSGPGHLDLGRVPVRPAGRRGGRLPPRAVDPAPRRLGGLPRKPGPGDRPAGRVDLVEASRGGLRAVWDRPRERSREGRFRLRGGGSSPPGTGQPRSSSSWSGTSSSSSGRSTPPWPPTSAESCSGFRSGSP